MHWVRGRQVVLLLVVAMVLVACGNGDNGDEEDPPPIGGEDVDEPGTSDDSDDPEASEEDDDDPYAVPDEVDEDYAERVINALFEVHAENTRALLEDYEQGESLREPEIRRLDAVFAGDYRTNAQVTLQAIADDPEVRDSYRHPEDIDQTRIHAHRVLHQEDECLLVAGEFDVTGVQREDPLEDFERVAAFSLSPAPSDGEQSEYNPAPWQLRDVNALVAGGEAIPEDQWDELEFGDTLDRTCEEDG